MAIRLASKRDAGTGQLKRFHRSGPLGAGISGLPIVANLEGWWQMGLTQITKDGSNFVSQANDQSGKGRHFVQATGISQPLWVASGCNGFPTLRFDGTNDFLQQITGFSLAKPFTFFIVLKAVTWTYADAYMYWAGHEPDLSMRQNALMQWSNTDGNIGIYDLTWASGITATTLANNTWGVISFTVAASPDMGGQDTNLYVNNNAAVNGNVATGPIENLYPTYFTIGSAAGNSNFANMEMAEGILYSGLFSAGDRNATINYLNAFYGAF